MQRRLRYCIIAFNTLVWRFYEKGKKGLLEEGRMKERPSAVSGVEGEIRGIDYKERW